MYVRERGIGLHFEVPPTYVGYTTLVVVAWGIDLPRRPPRGDEVLD